MALSGQKTLILDRERAFQKRLAIWKKICSLDHESAFWTRLAFWKKTRILNNESHFDSDSALWIETQFYEDSHFDRDGAFWKRLISRKTRISIAKCFLKEDSHFQKTRISIAIALSEKDSNFATDLHFDRDSALMKKKVALCWKLAF